MPQKQLPENLNRMDSLQVPKFIPELKKKTPKLIIRLAGSHQKKWHLVQQHFSPQECWGIFLGNTVTAGVK